MKGEIALLQKHKVSKMSCALVPGQTFEGTLEQEAHFLEMSKKIFLLAGGMAVQKFGTKLEKEQEALSNLADMMIDIYALESALRVPQANRTHIRGKATSMIEMTQVFAYEAFQRIEALAKETLASVETGDIADACRCSKTDALHAGRYGGPQARSRPAWSRTSGTRCNTRQRQ